MSDLSFAQILAWVAQASPAAAAAFDTWRERVRKVAADGTVSLGEMLGLLYEAQTELMNLLAVVNVPGSQKKQAILEMLAHLFDALPVLPLPVWLVWLAPLRPAIRAFVRQQFLDSADKLIESMYRWFLRVDSPSPPQLASVRLHKPT